jgi:predicted  nucleic acid-binding Zn-ribbon protein
VKKLVVLLVPILALSSCASLLKMAGGASEASLSAVDSKLTEEISALKAQVEELSTASSQIAELKQTLDELKIQAQEIGAISQKIDEMAARLDETQAAAAEIEGVKALIEEIQGRLDLLPKETLGKLVEILSSALESLGQ